MACSSILGVSGSCGASVCPQELTEQDLCHQRQALKPSQEQQFVAMLVQEKSAGKFPRAVQTVYTKRQRLDFSHHPPITGFAYFLIIYRFRAFVHVSSHPFEPFNKETPSWKKKRGRGVVLYLVVVSCAK